MKTTLTLCPASASVVPCTVQLPAAWMALYSSKFSTLSAVPLVSGRLSALLGAAVSIFTLRVACVAALPATSLTLAVTLVLAASAGMVLPKLALQAPPAATVAVRVMAPHTTVTVWPASALLVPLMLTPPVLLARLTTSLPLRAVMASVGAL